MDIHPDFLFIGDIKGPVEAFGNWVLIDLEYL